MMFCMQFILRSLKELFGYEQSVNHQPNSYEERQNTYNPRAAENLYGHSRQIKSAYNAFGDDIKEDHQPQPYATRYYAALDFVIAFDFGRDSALARIHNLADGIKVRSAQITEFHLLILISATLWTEHKSLPS